MSNEDKQTHTPRDGAGDAAKKIEQNTNFMRKRTKTTTQTYTNMSQTYRRRKNRKNNIQTESNNDDVPAAAAE